jgi:hypothetical protein
VAPRRHPVVQPSGSEYTTRSGIAALHGLLDLAKVLAFPLWGGFAIESTTRTLEEAGLDTIPFVLIAITHSKERIAVIEKSAKISFSHRSFSVLTINTGDPTPTTEHCAVRL